MAFGFQVNSERPLDAASVQFWKNQVEEKDKEIDLLRNTIVTLKVILSSVVLFLVKISVHGVVSTDPGSTSFICCGDPGKFLYLLNILSYSGVSKQHFWWGAGVNRLTLKGYRRVLKRVLNYIYHRE